jgi:hypothetical protein
MSIKANTVFKANFKDVSSESRLLYIYLMTHPQLNTVGVVQLNPEVSVLETGLSIEDFRKSTTELINKKVLKVLKFDSVVYFLLVKHYETNPTGSLTFKKAQDILNKLPEKVKEWVEQDIDISTKEGVFVEPTAQEVSDYCISIGHVVDGEAVVEYYSRQAELYRKKSWVDSRGKQIIDWKSKMRNVWCRDSNKLKKQNDAPIGYEYFHIKYGERIIYPDYWRGGLPQSKEGLIITEELRQAYERQRNRK